MYPTCEGMKMNQSEFSEMARKKNSMMQLIATNDTKNRFNFK